MFKIELLEKAEDELANSYDWYEDKQTGLGDRLYNEVSHYINLIEINPYQFVVKYNNEFRSASLRIFPYLIIYWIEESTATVFVTNVFHTGRSPLYY